MNGITTLFFIFALFLIACLATAAFNIDLLTEISNVFQGLESTYCNACAG